MIRATCVAGMAMLLCVVGGTSEAESVRAREVRPIAHFDGELFEQAAVEGKVLLNQLHDLLELEDFQQPMTLKEALGLIYEKFAAKNKELPILVNIDAFKGADPDQIENLYDTQVRFPPYPKRMSMQQALRITLAKIPVKADYLVRGGAIEIVPAEMATMAKLLEFRVGFSVKSRPFDFMMERLSDQSGLSITIDPRVGDKASTKISVTFRNDVSVRGALNTMTELADLKWVEIAGGGVLITTAEHAAKIPAASPPKAEKKEEAK